MPWRSPAPGRRGICPGLNNVIRAVVRCFWYRYGVRRISGIQYGYLGLLENSSWPLIPLDPDVVDDIQEKGGTILGSARGGGKQVEEIVDSLERLNINILITIGGPPCAEHTWRRRIRSTASAW